LVDLKILYKPHGEVIKDIQGLQYETTDALNVHQVIMKKKKAYMSLRTHGVLRFILCITVLLCTGWIYAGAAGGASTSTMRDEWQYFKGVEGPPYQWSF